MKRLPQVTRHKKLVVFWLIFSTFLLFFGGAINPMTASEQFKRRTQITSLLDPRNSDINALNDVFEQFLQESEQIAKTRDQFSSLEEYELHKVELFTYLHVKHKSDLMQYLCVDHLPTVREIWQSGTDDADGRTILATTLLLYRGYDAWAFAGPWHSWVELILENGTHLRILAKKGIGMNFWYLRSNDREVRFNPVQTIGFVVYELLLAALIVGVLFYIQKAFSQGSFVRHVVKSLFIVVVVIGALFIVAFAILLLFYRIIWGV